MVDKITNILKETLSKGSASEITTRSSYPPDGKSTTVFEEISKGATNFVPQRQSLEVRMQTGFNVQGEEIRPELGQTDRSFPSQSGGQSTKMETSSVAKRARTELLDQLNQEYVDLHRHVD